MLELAPLQQRVYKRVITELRCHTNLLLLQKAPEVCQRWLEGKRRNMFPQWGLGLGSIEVKNEALRRVFTITAKTVSTTRDDIAATDLEQELQLAGSFHSDAAKAVPDLTATRFGVRFQYLLPTSDLDALRRGLLLRCTGWTHFAEAFGATDSDLTVGWKFAVAGAQANLAIAPVSRQEIEKLFGARTAVTDDLRYTPEAALFFDGDWWVENAGVGASRRMIGQAREWLDRSFLGFVDALGQQTEASP